MEITLKNLGPINEATFTVGDLTVICGKNNTGKTYITYATYGFLDYWQKLNYWDSNDDILGLDSDFIDQLINSRTTTISFPELFKRADILITNAQKNFNNKISSIFNSNKALLKKSEVLVKSKNNKKINKPNMFNVRFIENDDNEGASISFKINQSKSEITLDVDKDENIPREDLIALINDAIKERIFSSFIPKAFIASAERTGAALFQREVDFTRSRLIDLLKETNINPQQLLGRFTAEYPLPVKHNIDFIRDLPNIVKKQSKFAQQYPEILQAFTEVAGGDYEVNQVGGINYNPATQPDLKLSLAESSSTVRSLVDIGFYLRHLAEKGDLLMIDEPELNLHPENQRKMARLIAMLVNAGIRVFITTHSDYIIKELNTLLILNKVDERLQMLAQREGYQTNELLKPEQLNIYMTTPDTRVTDKISYTLIPAKVTTESGIELTSFDETIEDINRIQDEIVWG